jgi:hypothetical protein
MVVTAVLKQINNPAMVVTAVLKQINNPSMVVTAAKCYWYCIAQIG